MENRVRKDLSPSKGTRTVVLFADADGLWREYMLPVSLSSQIVVEPDPYTRPLTMVLDEFERYCVLVADSRKARIFSLFLGEMEEHSEIFLEDEVPDRVRVNLSMTGTSTGVKGGLGDERIQRHIEDHVNRHLKHVADKSFDFIKDKGFTRVILGSTEEKILPRLRDHLHSYIRERIAGEIDARPDDHKETLKEKALEMAQDFERRDERDKVNRLLELHNAGDKAVLGLEPTLEALMMGQVHSLILENDFRAPGYVCPSDHFISTYLTECPLCGGSTEEFSDIADEMVEEAVSQNAEVEHVFADIEGFAPYKVGALLRFLL
jgi:peptide chain release factor subunit 1